MSLRPTLSPQLSQQLKLSPQLAQSLEILQLSTLELEDLINQALEENPALEIADDDGGDAVRDLDGQDNSEEEREARDDFGDSVAENREEDSYEHSNSPSSDISDSHGVGLDNQGNSLGDNPSDDYDRTNDDDGYPQLSSSSIALSVTTLLAEQVDALDLDARLHEAVTLLISYINDDGLLECSLEEIASEQEIGLDLASEALGVVQDLDPAGIGARSAQESLLLQLERKGYANSLVATLVQDHFGAMKEKRASALARLVGSSEEQVQDALTTLRGLNPYPLRSVTGEAAQITVADIVIEWVDDELSVMLSDNAPRIRLNSACEDLISEKKVTGQDRRFLREKIGSARWLLRAIMQRQRTLMRVGRAIAKYQRRFFEDGPKALQPLTMGVVAEELALHESTISRVANSKFVATPWGIYELRYFFQGKASTLRSNVSQIAATASRPAHTKDLTSNHHIDKAKNGAVSAIAVKQHLKEILQNEDTAAPLSDQAISDFLTKQGLAIARRTVSKYREELGYGSQYDRKR